MQIRADRETALHDLPPRTASVRSSDGTEIRFDLYDLHEGASGTTGVLIVPGFWRHRRYPSLQGIARLMNSLGCPAAVLDLRGHGESSGTYGFNLREHEDVEAVAKAFLENSSISSLILIGFSLGGAISISVAARSSLPIKGLLLISPVADMSILRPRMNLFSIRSHIAFSNVFRRPRFSWNFRTAEKIRGLDDIGKVRTPVCLIHVKDDWLVNHAHSELLFAEAGEPKELHILDMPGNLHADRIFTQAADRIEPLVRAFITRILKTG